MKLKPLKQKLNLKTGFFKKEKYILSIGVDALKITATSQAGENIIDIKFNDIKTVTISKQIPCEIEIRTSDKVYLGTFPIEDDISEVLVRLKFLLDKRLIYY